MTRRTFLWSTATPFAATAAIPPVSLQPVPQRPNLLFIVADEWRGQALPFAGDPNVNLPHLSRLAREGLFCSRAYTCYAVCCPSRAAMLTGKYPHAVGVRRNHSLLPLDQETMSAVLQRSGYRTGYIGKWHLDGRENPGFVPPERRRGFEYWAAYNVAHQHFDGVYFRDTPEPLQTSGFEGAYQTDLAIEFLRRRSEQPFFLYLSWVAPHSPFTPPPNYDRYDAQQLRLRLNVPRESEASTRKNLTGYYGLCTAVDANLGRILGELDQLGLARDTIVVFTSDHGEMLGSHGIDAIDLPYEESTRIPLVVRYPRKIKAGVEDKSLVSNVDFAPTLLSLCGAPAPPGMQGRNHTVAWTGKGRGATGGPVFAEGAIGQPEEWRMIVSGRYKLVAGADLSPTHLYDLEADPYELRNLVADASRRVLQRRLVEGLRRWAKS